MSIDILKKEFFRLLERRNFEPDTLTQMRKQSFDQFLDLGLPNQKWENWRFTNLNRLKSETFRTAGPEDIQDETPDIEKFNISGINTIVIVNGYFQKELSSFPEGIIMEPLLDYINSNPEKINNESSNPFYNLNTSFMDSGLAITIKKNTVIDKPLRFIYLFTSLQGNIMFSPQIHIICEENSSVQILEQITGNIKGTSFFNLVGSLTLSPNSSLDYSRIIQDNGVSNQFADFNVLQEKDSRFSFFQYSEASKISRLDLNCDLRGEGSECDLMGLSLSDRSNHSDNHIWVNHHASHCRSNQFFKSILKNESSGVFNGRTIVHKGTQKSDAKQSNKNLLLSKKAVMNSNPQLEIRAEDVKCTHSSTTGELDDDALFYMRSRGLDLPRSQALMVRGFALEELKCVRNKNVYDYLLASLESWLK